MISKFLLIFLIQQVKLFDMTNPEIAYKLFFGGSQLLTGNYGGIWSLVGLTKEQSFQVGAGLGGGIGRRQYVCGAINAGAIIIGLRFGNKALEDKDGKELANRIAGEFVSECEKLLGSSQCSALLQINLMNPDERSKAKQSGYSTGFV
jgi:hypothetical protein